MQDHFEQLEVYWPERYETRYGFFRPYVMNVIGRFLECGDLHFGFARVRCPNCAHEYLLAFSCKRRHFCPSCHQKRVIEFGEWLCTQVLKSVPHRQWVFSIPKRLRIYFMYDRKLLAKLSRCAWKVLSAYLKQTVATNAAVPGAAIAVHTFGEFQRFNPHLHIIATDGCFTDSGTFTVGCPPAPGDLTELFRHEVFKMLKDAGKITTAIIENMLSWRHSGFHVYCGPPIWPHDEKACEDLARYIVRASFSQQRLSYKPAKQGSYRRGQVIYRSKDGKASKIYDALDWLAQLTTHIPNRYEQMVRYYGYYSNKSRGMRNKAAEDDQPPALNEAAITTAALRQNWARLIQNIYQVDPLLCPKCKGEMKIIAFIEDDGLIRKILNHLGLWETRNHDPPENHKEQPSPNTDYDYTIDYTYSQLPMVDYWD